MTSAMTVRPTDNSIFNLRFPSEVISEMQAIHDEIARAAFGLFDQHGWNGITPLEDWLRAESMILKPLPIEVKEESDKITVTADVPGFTSDQLKVDVQGDTLRIVGKAEESSTDGDANKANEKSPAISRSSSSSRRVSCSMTLPTQVKTDGATAKLDKGVLTLLLPKAQPAKQIQITAA